MYDDLKIHFVSIGEFIYTNNERFGTKNAKNIHFDY